MESATQGSVNTVFARLIWELNDKKKSGAEKVAETAHRMGITSDIPPYPSIALGSQNVTPLEMASAYGTLATNGTHYPPTVITKVVDPTATSSSRPTPSGEQALTPEIAYATTSILKGVISRRHGPPREHRSPGGRQDRYVPGLPRCVVRRLHTAARDLGVGRLLRRREADAQRQRRARLRRHARCARLGQVHEAGTRRTSPRLDFPKQKAPKYTWKKSWSKQANTDKVPSLVGMTVSQAQAALKRHEVQACRRPGVQLGQEGHDLLAVTRRRRKRQGGLRRSRVKVSLGPDSRRHRRRRHRRRTPETTPTPEPEPEPATSQTPSGD